MFISFTGGEKISLGKSEVNSINHDVSQKKC